jgi:hypothetical protein
MEIKPAELLELVNAPLAGADLTPEEASEIKSFAAAPKADGLPSHLIEEKGLDPNAENAEVTDIRAQISAMGIPGKMKLALFGNSVCRALLIRDTNKMIQQFVIKNPKLALKEIEEFSRNQHLSDFVLRSIGDSKIWMKSNVVKYNLVTNAKTPQDIALKWLKYLQSNEIKKIAKSKNVPQLISTQAKKIAQDYR